MAEISPLRKEQLSRTRERILDGLLVAMKDGLAELSIPAVARAARVSIPTVYRHFPSKKALFEALAMHVGKKTRLVMTPPPKDPAALFAWIQEAFLAVERMDPTTMAAMSGVLGGEVRRAALMPGRLKVYETALGPSIAALPAEERARLLQLAVVLTASSTVRTFKSYLGLSAADAAQTVVWALSTLLDAAAQRAGGEAWKRRVKRSKST